MPGKVLISGVHKGFLGSRLLTRLTNAGYDCESSTFDICIPSEVEKTLKSQNWNHIFHFAAISHIPTCEKDPARAFQVNSDGVRTLVEKMREYAPQAKLYFTSTAQVYEAPSSQEIETNVVFDESRPIVPQNTYARSKHEAEKHIQKACLDWGLKAIILRLFNNTHHSQSPEFLLPYLYYQMLAVQMRGNKDVKSPIAVGNLELYRDIGNIDDLLNAFQILLTSTLKPEFSAQGQTPIFNICSGKARHLKTLAQTLAQAMDVNIEFVVDASRLRPGEPISIRGSHDKLTQATGWKPQDRNEVQFIESFLSSEGLL